jgi:NAD-dependent deacetylase
MPKKLIILTGSGISAESGIKTFRDSGGLWEEHKVEDVASIEGWYRNPSLVLEFYNQRRAQLATVEPNGAHFGLAELEAEYDVRIITQNVDNLHERAGSTNVLHLHGELTKACSSMDKSHVKEIGYRAIQVGEKSVDGSQLRPFIVWFGEEVPAMDLAIQWTSEADIFVIIGTSLQVYPAAGLVNEVPNGCPIYVVDPNDLGRSIRPDCVVIRENAVEGVRSLRQFLNELAT